MSSSTGLLFSYAIGAIFAIGGLLFLLLLDERRLLFGIPYLVIGLLLIGGVRGSQRRRKARETEGGGTAAPPAPRSH